MTFFKWVRRAVSARVNLLREFHHAEAVAHAMTFEVDRLKRELAEANLLLSALGREAVGE